MYKAYYDSPLGLIEIIGTEQGVVSVDFPEEGDFKKAAVHPTLKECVEQLDEYFRGVRREFSLRLRVEGTDFQRRVWQKLLEIPYGDTCSYKEIAVSLGNPGAVRAVGNANNRNRIAILIPCHRVIGSDGSMVGYAKGIWRKKWLLQLEKDHS
jgi:methylated-DNA-[protein]-cysteine S-methyltransferase